MDWNSRLLTAEQLKPYGVVGDFKSRIAALLAQQAATWPALRNAILALAQVQYLDLDIRGSHVRAQHNPSRIVSTSARVDAASINSRPCFLCPTNLPAEEKGIEFGEGYVALCNPFPVLENHLVIATKEHTPQAIANRFGDMLGLAEALGPEYFTLYNGPACGASAPDHHHFQACLARGVPLFDEMENWPRVDLFETSDLISYAPLDYRVNILIARSENKGRIESWFADTLIRSDDLAKHEADEPMLNLIARFDGRRWTVYLFQRSKHRPACYFAEGSAKFTISPAGIDLAGILVVPDPDDFRRLTAEIVEQIYREVSL